MDQFAVATLAVLYLASRPVYAIANRSRKRSRPDLSGRDLKGFTRSSAVARRLMLRFPVWALITPNAVLNVFNVGGGGRQVGWEAMASKDHLG